MLGQRNAHRVDQERHVVVDDLHHRVAAVETVGSTGIEHADLGLPGFTLVGERAIADGDRRPDFGASQRQLFLRQTGVEGVGEGQHVRQPFGWNRGLHRPTGSTRG